GGISETRNLDGDEERAASEIPGVASPSKVDWNQHGDQAPYSLVANPDPLRLRMPMPKDAPPPLPKLERELSAAENPAHAADKVVDKPTHARSAAIDPRTIASPPAEYMSKQQTYLERSRALDAQYSRLSQAERDAKRAELKRAVLGE